MFDRELAISAVEGQRAPVFTAHKDAYHSKVFASSSVFFSTGCRLVFRAADRRGLLTDEALHRGSGQARSAQQRREEALKKQFPSAVSGPAAACKCQGGAAPCPG